ncbi:hypothetical protein SGRIM128S_00156 [Streptomyces griseomycini]
MSGPIPASGGPAVPLRSNLLAAADVCERHPEEAARLGVDEESAAWRDAAEAVHIPYNDEIGVHEQHAGFTATSAGTSRTRAPTSTR